MPAQLEPGDTFAGYLIERHLGAGGMGDVYQVRHEQLDKSFALKVLPASLNDDPTFAARFQREMKTVSQLEHPNIVSTTNAGTVDGRVWFTMTFVHGSDAHQALNIHQHGLPPARVANIIDSVGAAVDYAHRRGVLHRDIKPANILLESRIDNDDARIYLSDFGIAKAIDDDRPITTSAQSPYTLDFASPEQIRGDVLTGQTDIYSLGATLFTLLTGRVPFPAATSTAKMLKHLDEPAPRPTMLVPALPPELDNVVARAMAKDPGRRYRSCQEMAVDVRQAVTAQQTDDYRNSSTRRESAAPTFIPGNAAPPETDGLPGRVHRRRRIFLVAIVATVAVLGTGSAMIWAAGNSGQATGSSSSVAAPSETAGTAAANSVDGPTNANSPAADVVRSSTRPVPTTVQPLADLLEPAPERKTGTISGTTVAAGPAYLLGPSNCGNGRQQISLNLGRLYSRVTANIQQDDAAPPATRTKFTATADGNVVSSTVLEPRSGKSVDLDVTGRDILLLDLETAGQGTCTSDDYLVFLTSALAYP